VVEKINNYYLTDYYNPSATYKPSLKIKKDLENARESLSKYLKIDKSELYFTSCATESNNWVLNSALKNKSCNLVISAGEHACIYETAKNLQNKGFDVRIAALNNDGTVNENDLISKIDDKTALVSIIHVSNETGVVNDLKALFTKIKKKYPKVLCHSDGVQAFCKIPTDLKAMNVDFYSISGHKFGAPKGVGALYISKKANLTPFVFGGGQENGRRSGTENVAGIIAMADAAKIYREHSDTDKIDKIHALLIEKLKEISNVQIIGDGAVNSNRILAVSFIGCKAEILQSMLADEGVLVGRGSACSSRHAGNRVLAAMGINQSVIDGTLRISIAPETSAENIETAIEKIKIVVAKLRGNKIG